MSITRVLLDMKIILTVRESAGTRYFFNNISNNGVLTEIKIK
jgi:hypothetical protein